MISIIACCYSAKLCAHAARAFQSQHYKTIIIAEKDMVGTLAYKKFKLELWFPNISYLHTAECCIYRKKNMWWSSDQQYKQTDEKRQAERMHTPNRFCFKTCIKIIYLINSGSLEEHFQHLNILCLPKLYSFSVGKFMHSYHNKLLPNHFDEYFVPLSSIHYHSTRLATSKILFLPRVNSSSGKCSLKFISPKVWSSIPDDIKFSTTFTCKWKLKKHFLHEKNS